MTSGSRAYRTRFLALLLIGVGAVWLLAGILGANLVILFTYWPLLLIGVGLDYLRRGEAPYGVAWTVWAVIVLLALMVIGPAFGLGRGARVTTSRFSERLGETRSAQVNLELASAPTTVHALEDRDTLIDAELTHTGTIDFRVRGGRDKVVTLKRRGRNARFFASAPQTRWDVGLSPQVPIDLRVDADSGRARLDLGALALSRFRLDGGSGGADVILPAGQERYEVEVDGGSGSIRLKVADRAALDLSYDGGSGSATLELGRGVSARLELEGGSGSIQVVLPPDAAARLELRDDGSGALGLPDNLLRVSGRGDTGVWETPDFDRAGRQIVVVVQDAGSGSITLR